LIEKYSVFFFGISSWGVDCETEKEMAVSWTATVAALNDALRTTLQGGNVVITAGVHALTPEVKAQALSALRGFSAFTKDNDPHGEHDFGSFELAGEKFFFKIDYYDARMEFGSEDPSDPGQTTRVLTLMLAEDY
jgi:hypothetical protein